MSSPCGSVTISFNGEVYNHTELKIDLEKRGYRHQTNCDTEVVLNSYLCHGTEFTKSLNGQWAISIWDNRRELLFLSRDRPGIRPLYYFNGPDFFAFASEIKALLAHPAIEAKICPYSLVDTLTFWSPLPGNSSFSDIYEILPGENLVFTKNGIQRNKYWSFSHHFETTEDKKTIIEDIRNSLTKSVSFRLRSDVPVASYLSGGIDSYIISSIASKLTGKLQTFSISFPDTSSDESFYQKIAAQELGTDHKTLSFDINKFNKYFQKAIYHTEKPLLRAGPIPLLALSEMVHESGYKVVLTGEGADEIFCGYDIFRELKSRIFQRKHPKFYSDKLFNEKSYSYEKTRIKIEHHKLLSHFFRVNTDNDIRIFSHANRWRNSTSFKSLLSDDLIELTSKYNPIETLLTKIDLYKDEKNAIENAQIIEFCTLLPGYILSSQSDRAGLANSVETRYPFLDHNVIDLANRIPSYLKLSGLKEKKILKDAFKLDTPEIILRRPKRPYECPIGDYILNNLRTSEYINETLSDSNIKKHNIFSAKKINLLKDKLLSSSSLSHRDSTIFLAILSTQELANTFITGKHEKQPRTKDSRIHFA